jgi:cobalamin synthase
VTIAYAHALKGFFHRRLGGITGDVMGFAEETGEILFLIAVQVLS